MRTLQQGAQVVTVEVESDHQFVVRVDKQQIGKSVVFDTTTQRDEVLHKTQTAIMTISQLGS